MPEYTSSETMVVVTYFWWSYVVFLLSLAEVPFVSAQKMCLARKEDPLQVTMASNRAHCFSHCMSKGQCRLMLFKKKEQFIEDQENEGSQYHGNCVLMEKHENNLLSERREDGYEVCRTYEVLPENLDAHSVPPYVCLAETRYDVTEVAHKAGFDIEVTEPGLNVTRFYKNLAGDVPFDLMEDRCAAAGGILPQAYDDESIKVLLQQGEVQLPIRLGLKVNRLSSGAPAAVWMVPYIVDWTATESDTCAKFAKWDDSVWQDARAAHLDENRVIKPGSFLGPVTQVTCQFMGPNVALGKKVTAYYINDNYSERSLLTDGDWNEENIKELNFYAHTEVLTGIWAAVDLGSQHLVNAILYKADGRDYPHGTPDIETKTATHCYVGDHIPDPGVIIDSPPKSSLKMLNCGFSKGWVTGVQACSCNLFRGRFVIIRMRKLYGLSEVAVFGIPYNNVV